ncbi:hypothetical protein U1Q18_019336 [Sarracenia purpurea var. burkii]
MGLDGRQRKGTVVERKAVERRWRRSGPGGGAAERCLRRRRAAERRLRQRRAGGASLVAERWSGACGGRRAGGAARWERRSATRGVRVDADAVHGGATCATGGDELASRDAATTRDAAATQATVDGANRALRAMLGKTAGLRPEGQGDSVVGNRGGREKKKIIQATRVALIP